MIQRNSNIEGHLYKAYVSISKLLIEFMEPLCQKKLRNLYKVAQIRNALLKMQLKCKGSVIDLVLMNLCLLITQKMHFLQFLRINCKYLQH